jgi:hypothetical protein
MRECLALQLWERGAYVVAPVACTDTPIETREVTIEHAHGDEHVFGNAALVPVDIADRGLRRHSIEVDPVQPRAGGMDQQERVGGRAHRRGERPGHDRMRPGKKRNDVLVPGALRNPNLGGRGQCLMKRIDGLPLCDDDRQRLLQPAHLCSVFSCEPHILASLFPTLADCTLRSSRRLAALDLGLPRPRHCAGSGAEGTSPTCLFFL